MPDQQIMVSIICNTYNHEKYIAKTIEGFLNQKTTFSYEILIHDDASTDKTAEIIKTYEQKYPELIKPIYQKENQYSKVKYISATYQYPRAKGKYIAFCEGDDFWTDSYKLQKQVDFLEQNEEYAACVHRYIVVDENNEEKDIKTFGYYEEEGPYTLKDFEQKELPSQLASLVYRNFYLDPEKGYPKEFYDIKIQGDIKIFLFILTNGNIYRMKDIMSAYRFVYKADGTSWSSRSLRKIRGYNNWKQIRRLEKVFCQRYGKKISLEHRRKNYGIETIVDLKRQPNFRNFVNAMIVLFGQKGVFSFIAQKGIKKIWNRT